MMAELLPHPDMVGGPVELCPQCADPVAEHIPFYVARFGVESHCRVCQQDGGKCA